MMKTNRLVLLTIVLGALFAQEAQAFYNPCTGRWLSRDPVGDLGSDEQFGFLEQDLGDEDAELNPFRFVANAPLTFIDRFGLAAKKPDAGKTEPICACKCKAVEISYTPKLKKGGLQFAFYKPHGEKNKRYGFILHVTWKVEGDSALCHYGLDEPPGGVTGSDPNGAVRRSDGTGGMILVPKTINDNIGIREVGKGQYSINVSLTQTYACWDAELDPASQPPSMTAGPFSYSGSGTKKY